MSPSRFAAVNTELAEAAIVWEFDQFFVDDLSFDSAVNFFQSHDEKQAKAAWAASGSAGRKSKMTRKNASSRFFNISN